MSQEPPLHPDGWKFEGESDRLLFRGRWWTNAVFFLVIWCTVWDGILFAIYGFQVKLFLSTGQIIWPALLFPLLHVAVGLAMTYYLIALMLNETVVEVTRERLSVKFKPLRWRGAIEVASADVAQLYVMHRKVRRKSSYVHQFDLNAQTKDGSWVRLLANQENPAVVKFLEYHIERFLGLENRRVQGEWSGKL